MNFYGEKSEQEKRDEAITRNDRPLSKKKIVREGYPKLGKAPNPPGEHEKELDLDDVQSKKHTTGEEEEKAA